VFALESLPYINLTITSGSIFSRTSGHYTINEPATSTQSQVRHNYKHTLRVRVRAISIYKDIYVRTTSGYMTVHTLKYNRALVHILIYLIDERHLYISTEMA
jgi:hypothetical protein